MPMNPDEKRLIRMRASASMIEIWTEKYRPSTLDDVVGQQNATKRLKSYVKAGNMPHLLFSGPAGVGKTTSAIALARDMFGENWRNNFYELNASDERGIDVVRVNIKEYARTAPFGGAPFKIIFLDEADALTSDAQAALRRTMEKYSSTCRFVLSCNYSSKIIDPIQSRCAIFRFTRPSEDDVASYLDRIVKGEKIDIDGDALRQIILVSEGDVRKAVNTLQVAASFADSGKIDLQKIYEATAMADPSDIRKMVGNAMEGKFIDARKTLDKLLIDQGLSGEDIIKAIHSVVIDEPGIKEEKKIRMLERIGEADFRMVEGSNARIQLEALLASFALM